MDSKAANIADSNPKPDTDNGAYDADDCEEEGNNLTNNDNALSQPQPGLSKNQLKKLKKREKWLEIKSAKRKCEKQKRKQKLAERREKGEDVGPSRKKLKTHTMENSSCRIRVALDLSLDEYMNEKDARSMIDQLRYCYSANRRAANPLQLYLCGSSGKCMKRLEEIGDVKGWDVFVNKRCYDEAFAKEDIVYLSSESENLLSTLSEDKVYIIGGLVDHNQHKGLCHRLAEEKGIAHAQLPIQDYFHMKTRKVLAVNHVFSILLKFTELNDWKESFLSIMPQRIQASLSERKSDGQLETRVRELPESEEKADGALAENEMSKDPAMTCPSPDRCATSEGSPSREDEQPCSGGEQGQGRDCTTPNCDEPADASQPQEHPQHNHAASASQGLDRSSES